MATKEKPSMTNTTEHATPTPPPEPPSIDQEVAAITADVDAAVVREARAFLMPIADRARGQIALFREFVTREEKLIRRIRACQKALRVTPPLPETLATAWGRTVTEVLDMDGVANAAERGFNDMKRLTAKACRRTDYDRQINRQSRVVQDLVRGFAAVSGSREDLEVRFATAHALVEQVEGYIRAQHRLGPGVMTREPSVAADTEPVLKWPLFPARYQDR
jgi:hypothetical protein